MFTLFNSHSCLGFIVVHLIYSTILGYTMDKCIQQNNTCVPLWVPTQDSGLSLLFPEENWFALLQLLS